jgi:hypothetical protein
MRERTSARHVLHELRQGWPDALEIIKALPPRSKRLLERMQHGQLRVPLDTRSVDRLRREWLQQRRRSDRAIIGTVLLLGAVFWLALSLEPRLLGWLLGALALGLWLSVWLTRSR